MKVLFAGISGTRKSKCLENLRKAVGQLFPHQRIFTIPLSDGQEGIPVLDRFLYGRNPIPFLRQPEEAQKEQWRKNFTEIQKHFERSEKDHHFLGLHFIYRFEQVASCIADLHALANWRPDYIITFIDDAYCIRERIHRGGYRSFTLSELVLWRNEEILVGDLLARIINPENPIPNFVVAIKHPAEMLARLLFSKNVARVYISYNITDTRNRKSLRATIDRFRQKIHQQTNCVVFDPLTIDELPLLSLDKAISHKKTLFYNASKPQHRWPILDPQKALASEDDLVYPLPIPIRELENSKRSIDAQVKRRDFRMIDQSHYLIVYRPTLHGKAELSTGVNDEIKYAYNFGIPVIWYIKKGEDPLPTSPFAPKNPNEDPNYIYSASEEQLWEKINGLHLHIDSRRDHFLR
jgi:adenylate kinase